MISVDTLENLFYARLDEAAAADSSYGSTPKPMFTNGKFNSDNWNGGDDIIRQLIYDMAVGDHSTRLYPDVEYDEDRDYTVICQWACANHHQYMTIIFDEFEDPSVDVNIAFFRIYKNRGRTEMATFNGAIMTTEQYVKVLNVLEKAGITFRI